LRHFPAENWANEKIYSDLEAIGYETIQYTLRYISEGFETNTKEINEESHGIRGDSWYNGEDVKHPCRTIGRLMSEEGKKHTSTWDATSGMPTRRLLGWKMP
jgi:hypothetical protein